MADIYALFLFRVLCSELLGTDLDCTRDECRYIVFGATVRREDRDRGIRSGGIGGGGGNAGRGSRRRRGFRLPLKRSSSQFRSVLEYLAREIKPYMFSRPAVETNCYHVSFERLSEKSSSSFTIASLMSMKSLKKSGKGKYNEENHKARDVLSVLVIFNY